ncbi:aminodeoxychorismate lyase [Neobacillus jeddahensis]|uniref:aminodeoxychorismate lyase n=1 Tax=Neobacillus jeddahensis TaxID=1461580 RepID=UPI000B0EEE62|nr:aminodeoxychorismate lyase [Neobacillus jeddahensis]
MKINFLSSFASGILIATTIFGTVYFVDRGNDDKAATQSTTEVKTVKVSSSDKEMKKALESSGYVVQKKSEYDKTISDAKAASQKQDKPAEDASTKTVTKVIVNVSDGMTSIDVGNMLVQAKMIPNAYDFSKEIEQKGLENKLRPGVYIVDSEMSHDAVIGAIFK